MPRKKKVTQKDLSIHLGISEYTVSKALRGMSGMSESTRNDVLQLARKWGYRTKEQERSFLVERVSPYAGQQRRIVLVVSMFSFVNTLLITSVQETIEHFGGKLDIVMLPKSAADVSRWLEEHNVQYADGLIINPLIPYDIEQTIIDLPIPKILISYPDPLAPVDSIIWDVYYPVYQSTKHLINTGHERIIFIGNIIDQRGYSIRWQAFCDAMRDANLDVEPDHHFFHNRISDDEELLAEFSKKIQTLSPTALVSNTDVSWIYYICNTLNKKIPEDMSLISCELIQKPKFTNLTCHLFMIREVGERASERILWRMANPHSPFEHLRIQGKFMEGNTVNKFMA